MNDEPDVLNTAQAGRMLGCHANHVRRMCHAGVIPHVRLGRKILIPKIALNDWLMTMAKRSIRSTTSDDAAA